MTPSDATLGHVLLVEPNPALRSAILLVLDAERYHVEACDSLEQVLVRQDGRARVIALVAWQSMEGLLAEQHRQRLVELTSRLRLVLMVPRRWARLLDRTDLGAAVAGFVSKPFEADELLATLQRALGTPVEA
jgi:DNA-binding response OmpR family regulator